jgi:hypothetical protein
MGQESFPTVLESKMGRSQFVKIKWNYCLAIPYFSAAGARPPFRRDPGKWDIVSTTGD